MSFQQPALAINGVDISDLVDRLAISLNVNAGEPVDPAHAVEPDRMCTLRSTKRLRRRIDRFGDVNDIKVRYDVTITEPDGSRRFHFFAGIPTIGTSVENLEGPMDGSYLSRVVSDHESAKAAANTSRASSTSVGHQPE